MTFQVTGQAGDPASGVSAVALKIEAVAPDKAGALVAYPSDATGGPVTVSYSAGENAAGSDFTRITSTGKVTIRNDGDGPVHILADVRGYFLDASAVQGGNEYYPVPADYRYDTRKGLGPNIDKKPIPANGSVTINVAGQAGIPAGANAVAMNLVAMNHTTRGWLSVHPSDQPDPGGFWHGACDPGRDRSLARVVGG